MLTAATAAMRVAPRRPLLQGFLGPGPSSSLDGAALFGGLRTRNEGLTTSILLRALPPDGPVHALDMRVWAHCLNDADVQIIVRVCRETLVHLTLDGCDVLTPRALAAVATGCARLRTLALRGCGWVNAALAGLLRGRVHENVEVLTLSACARLDGDVLKQLVASFPALRRLDLAECALLSDASSLQALGSLEALSLAGCTALHLPSLDGLLLSLQLLELLDLSRTNIDNETLFGLVQRRAKLVPLPLPPLRLRALILDGCALSSYAVLQIVGLAAGLQTLHVTGTGGVNDAFVRSVVELCPRLESLRGMNGGLADIAGCSRLRTLGLSGSAVVAAGDMNRLGASLPLLEALDCEGAGVDDAGLAACADGVAGATNVAAGSTAAQSSTYMRRNADVALMRRAAASWMPTFGEALAAPSSCTYFEKEPWCAAAPPHSAA